MRPPTFLCCCYRCCCCGCANLHGGIGLLTPWPLPAPCRSGRGASTRDIRQAVELLKFAGGLLPAASARRHAGTPQEAGKPQMLPVQGFPDLAFNATGRADALRELALAYQVRLLTHVSTAELNMAAQLLVPPHSKCSLLHVAASVAVQCPPHLSQLEVGCSPYPSLSTAHDTVAPGPTSCPPIAWCARVLALPLPVCSCSVAAALR